MNENRELLKKRFCGFIDALQDVEIGYMVSGQSKIMIGIDLSKDLFMGIRCKMTVEDKALFDKYYSATVRIQSSQYN